MPPESVDALTAGFQAALQPLNRVIGDTSEEDSEWRKCAADPAYFISNYCFIFWKDQQKWLKLDPWPCQIETVSVLGVVKMLLILKARQMGFTWIVLCYLLWLCIFRPAQQAYLFSIGDREAKDLTGFRLTGMVQRLPEWMKERCGGITTGVHNMFTGHGSRVTSMPSTAGRSYTATFVLVDEADFSPDINALLAACEPAVEGGGQIVLLSTSDKAKPLSRFKTEYRLAKQGLNNYTALFFGWKSHPGRTQEWYDKQRRSIMAATGALDLLQQEWPSTDIESLAPRSLDKRIATVWLQQCFNDAVKPMDLQKAIRMY